MTTIIGIKVNNRMRSAIEVQNLLTKHGCSIKTRIGLHEGNCQNNEHSLNCSHVGIILLEIVDDFVAEEITKELCDIENIEIQHMRF